MRQLKPVLRRLANQCSRLVNPRLEIKNLAADFERADFFFCEREWKFAHKSFQALATERNGFVETAYSSTFESTKTRIRSQQTAT
jgi:hypothetical protein